MRKREYQEELNWFGYGSWVILVFLTTVFLMFSASHVEAKALKVKVIKAVSPEPLPPATSPGSNEKRYWPQAGTWIPDKNICIHAVSIPELSDIGST